jgi:uroporphyrinogen-III decarboxylase
MNGYQRILTAMKGEQPDSIPVMLHNFMMAAKEAGYTQAEYRSDPEKIANTFIQAVEKYQYDGILGDLREADILENPDISKDERIQFWLEAGAHMLSNGDSPAGPEMISPEMYREFAKPYETKMATYTHELGLNYILHICGNPGVNTTGEYEDLDQYCQEIFVITKN